MRYTCRTESRGPACAPHSHRCNLGASGTQTSPTRDGSRLRIPRGSQGVCCASPGRTAHRRQYQWSPQGRPRRRRLRLCLYESRLQRIFRTRFPARTSLSCNQAHSSAAPRIHNPHLRCDNRPRTPPGSPSAVGGLRERTHTRNLGCSRHPAWRSKCHRHCRRGMKCWRRINRRDSPARRLSRCNR